MRPPNFSASAVLPTLLLCVASPTSVAAESGSVADAFCLHACRNCIESIHFADVNRSLPDAPRTCRSGLGVTSLYLCMRLYCGDEARDHGVETFGWHCETEYGVTAPAYAELAGRYTEEDVARLERVEYRQKTGESVREVVVPSEKHFTTWAKTLDATQYVHHYHFWYGAAMMMFWAVVVAIGMGNRLILALSSRQTHTSEKAPGKISTWLRRRVLLPAAFGHRRAQSIWWCTVPLRVQTLTILVFLIMNVFFCVHGFKLFPGNFYFPAIHSQILRYVSDRTGIISFANFPVIWLFGMRNNLLMWLTGWDFGTYNNFHRWVARIATAQAVVHSIGYTIMIVEFGGWNYYAFFWTWMFWWAGQVATILMCVLLGASIYWVRRQQYELFLILHIVFSVIVLVTMLLHVSIFNGMYNILFWIPLFIWVIDRVARTLRIFAFNPFFWDTKALATYDASSNIVRLQVPSHTSFYTPKAGTYYFLMVLNDARCWESHPFTVALPSNRNKGLRSKILGEDSPLLEPRSDDETDGLGGHGEKDAMTFLIRPYDSFTRRLREKAEEHGPLAASTVRVVVEGPYGHTEPLHRFKHVLFLVGGSGIVVPLSYLHSLTSPSIHIHWAVREPRFAEAVLQTEFRNAPDVSVDIYMTASPDLLEGVRCHAGRLDVAAEVESAVGRVGKESLAVVACGPAGLADDARRAVVEALGRAEGVVEYFEESFQW
ncbi:hypothetical protein S7711_07761 [Stachybotrys chartarum IBT 7711]|uniref:FAD-binding FR-type domain-containing protein n=1 Tax=Stachybotrys chartarum (strain CBS 109288 / IBT 7711) TaxID=1280523 RepID=A0A084B8N9_STACB|nr:hypothetical protein S7711_07761 [Stachybotrys chartarum IBT 7711]